jgi:hypothetical protein
MLDEKPLKPWFNPFRRINAGLVKGVPWLEDLYRFPKQRIRVEFIPKDPGGEAVELSQESLYSLFRRYGKLAEITSQPHDSKVMPKFAYVDFALVRDAVMARNCMHGFLVQEKLGGGKLGTVLRLSYEKKTDQRNIWNWISSHPRLVIPVVAALIAAITVVIFDPIREFFIKTHVKHSFSITDNRLYRWFKRQTSDILLFARRKHDKSGLNAVWNHRKGLIEKVQGWLLESSDTFIVVQGPRGSGKRELVLDQSLKGRKNVLVIDCKPIAEARGESSTIKNLATSVGYRPIFSWANSMSSLVDLAIQSTTGVKSGFSETLESQVVKILHTTASALKEVSLDGRSKLGKDAELSEDAFLEAHPENRAVVVIDNFLPKNEQSSLVYDKVAEWAAALVQNNIAHVIFLTHDSTYSKSLARALPDRIFRLVSLGDLSPMVAKNYVISRLASSEQQEEEETDDETKSKSKGRYQMDFSELDYCIKQLGGRLTDLDSLARRIKTGTKPKQAADEIITQNANELIKMYLLGAKPAENQTRKWTSEQAWYLIKGIAEKESLGYNEVLLSNTFSSSTSSSASNGELALESLADAELITIAFEKGRPDTIKPGKPMYMSAFSVLNSDPILKARMDLLVMTELAKIEAKIIEKAEVELAVLGSLPRHPPQTAGRITYLLKKVEDSQNKIFTFEKDIGVLKKLLTK